MEKVIVVVVAFVALSVQPILGKYPWRLTDIDVADVAADAAVAESLAIYPVVFAAASYIW